MAVKEIRRHDGLSEATFYKWPSKYGEKRTADLHRARELDAENVRLKKLLAGTHLGIEARMVALWVLR